MRKSLSYDRFPEASIVDPYTMQGREDFSILNIWAVSNHSPIPSWFETALINAFVRFNATGI